MDKSNHKKQNEKTSEYESVSKRVAEELHENIDRAAEKGEAFEQQLHERGEKVQEQTMQLQNGVKRIIQENPWMVAGGSLALGFVLGSLIKRR